MIYIVIWNQYFKIYWSLFSSYLNIIYRNLILIGNGSWYNHFKFLTLKGFFSPAEPIIHNPFEKYFVSKLYLLGDIMYSYLFQWCNNATLQGWGGVVTPFISTASFFYEYNSQGGEIATVFIFYSLKYFSFEFVNSLINTILSFPYYLYFSI